MRLWILWALAVPLAAQQYRAFWADAFHVGYKTPAEVDRMVEDVALARGNAIFIEIRHRGGSYFLKSIEPPVEDATYQQGFDSLAYLIEKAHARGIEVHAWYPVTPLWPFPARRPVDARHAWNRHGPGAAPDQMWMTVSVAGAISGSVDPGHPGAAEYLADIIVDPARHYNLDGLHLDYIRYPEDAVYGWNATAVARFNRLENRFGSPVAADARWGDFRRRQVTELVRQVYLRAIEIKPSLKISAATISWGDGPANDQQFRTRDAYTRVFQDWRSWLEEGILDIAMPMNYFAEPRNAAFLDRWLEWEKDRAYGRAVMPGLAAYLNTIPDSLRQLERALKPSSAGNAPAGVAIYSYASTNILNAQGLPITPNAEFYQAVANAFGRDATPPVFPWKAQPAHGAVLGKLHVEGGPAWLKDGVEVSIESASGARRTMTDGSGFWGAVGLDPGLYSIRMERGGYPLFRTAAQDLRAGQSLRFDIFLKEADFSGALPRLRSGPPAAAPGEVITLAGALLAGASERALAVPLPQALGRTSVLVNGVNTALLSAAPGFIELQMPFTQAESWDVTVRHAGMESQTLRIPSATMRPVLMGVRRNGRYLEMWLTGLGMVSPAPAVGAGGNPQEPYNRVTGPLDALVDGRPARITYAGLLPWQPHIYQVNVELPEGIESGTVRLEGAGGVSVSARF